MNLPTSPAIKNLIPKSTMLAGGLYYMGDGEAITAMIPNTRLPLIPLDPRAADGAIVFLIPKMAMLLRCLTDTVRDQR